MGIIFAVPGHIEKIKSGEKTQTRRAWREGMKVDPYAQEVRVNGRLRYAVGKMYAVIPKRGQKGVGWVKIKRVWCEYHRRAERIECADENIHLPPIFRRNPIIKEYALAEGEYTPEEYEALWDKLNPNYPYICRLAIEFMWVEK